MIAYSSGYLGDSRAIRRLQQTLQAAFDMLEEMDDETFQVINGESIADDLDVTIRELDVAADWIVSSNRRK